MRNEQEIIERINEWQQAEQRTTEQIREVCGKKPFDSATYKTLRNEAELCNKNAHELLWTLGKL